MSRNLGHLIAGAVRLRPAHPAVIQGDVTVTYGELDARMNRVAHALRALGIRQGDRVAFLFGNEYKFVEAFFGAMRAGAVSVPLNVRLPDATLAYILEHSEARLLVASSGLADRAGALATGAATVEQVVLDTPRPPAGLAYETLLAAASPDPLLLDTGPDELCMLPYTSGSTGRPKGVLLTHWGQLWNADVMRKCLMIDHTERALVAVPLYHKNAMAGSLKPFLTGGGTVVILPGFDPAEVIWAIDRYRCTYTGGVPAMFKMLVAETAALAKYDVSSLRFAMCGSATVPEETMHEFEARFGAPVGEGYGLTEGGPVVCTTPRWGLRKHGSAGPPLPGCQVRLLDPERGSGGRPVAGTEEVATGEVGELVVRNPGIAKGYYKQPELTRDRFTADGWLYTGDLARRDAQGYLSISGRKDDMINVGGEHVYPKEVEDLLQRHPRIVDAAVVP
ncbi:MAG: acyl--CoA ligase, partial [Armatimonadetes bacterium]|nr:acyl--CoA ligase [Armatimonadota bacterium]